MLSINLSNTRCSNSTTESLADLNFIIPIKDQHGSDGVMISLRTGLLKKRDSISGRERDSSLSNVQTCLGAHTTSCSVGITRSFTAEKLPGREADNSLITADLMNE